MRSIKRLAEPNILADNKETWLAEYQADKASGTKRYRYRHPDIKSRLKEESADKCVYCESMIGHNTPGDIEHKVPTSKDETLHFTWSNLTIACTECNRRKNDYHDAQCPFLDPHADFIEGSVEHYGPLVLWVTGNVRAEVTLKTLKLNDHSREKLVVRKIQVLADFVNLIERYEQASNATLKSLLLREIEDRISVNGEYSGMLHDVACKKGLTRRCSGRP